MPSSCSRRPSPAALCGAVEPTAEPTADPTTEPAAEPAAEPPTEEEPDVLAAGETTVEADMAEDGGTALGDAMPSQTTTTERPRSCKLE